MQSRADALDAVINVHHERLLVLLTWTFGSREAAHEYLNEAIAQYLELPETAEIHSPFNYILKMARNAGKNRLKAENRRARLAAEIEEALQVADDAPGPEQVAEGRADLAEFYRVLAELPTRQRIVLNRICNEGKSGTEVSEELGISVRTVVGDLRRGLDLCAARMGRRQQPPGGRETTGEGAYTPLHETFPGQPKVDHDVIAS